MNKGLKATVFQALRRTSDTRNDTTGVPGYEGVSVKGLTEDGEFCNFLVKAQLPAPQGRSQWARWVREGLLKDTDVYWAYRWLNRTGGRREWLGFHLQRNGRPPITIDVSSESGRTQLKKLDRAMKSKLESEKEGAMPTEMKANTGDCPVCETPRVMGADGAVTCLVCDNVDE